MSARQEISLAFAVEYLSPDGVLLLPEKLPWGGAGVVEGVMAVLVVQEDWEIMQIQVP